MALSALTFRRIEDQAVSSASVDAYLDALYTAFQATEYTDGTTRTPGSGRAWTATRGGSPTEYVLLTPPSGDLSAKVLIAGKSSVATPKMWSPDTFLTHGLHVGLGPDGGVLSTWDGTGTSDPLGSGKRFTGFVRCSAACTGGTGFACVNESAESVVVAVKIGSSWYAFTAGALFDPDSEDPADIEVDGRVYGVFTTGSTAMSATCDSTTSPSWLGENNGAGGGAHGVYVLPRTSTYRAIHSVSRRSFAAGASSQKLASGAVALLPRWCEDGTSGAWIGTLRGVRRGPQARARQTMFADGAHKAYILAGSDSTEADATYLLAV